MLDESFRRKEGDGLKTRNYTCYSDMCVFVSRIAKTTFINEDRGKKKKFVGCKTKNSQFMHD